jgi:NADH:ubiquinone oxidoreductase subunit F (NADH-binding)
VTVLEPLARPVSAPTGVARLFAGSSPSWTDHIAAFGPAPRIPAADLLESLEASGLSGRGGAAFPTWRKLAGTKGANAVVIANGAEGEPVSAKDATLLATAPHLVIDGLLIAAATIGARSIYLYAGSASVGSVRRAIAERDGDSAAKSIVLREAPDTFVSGEASAVVRALSGGPALPRDHVIRLSTAGLSGRPTLVQNVETLAHVALIARFGARWFRGVGTPDEPGTRLLSVSVPGSPVRVMESAGGTPLTNALRDAGVDPATLAAVLVGGYHGGWVPAESFGLPISATALAGFGAAPGAGILVGLPRGRCGIAAAATIATYLAGQSAKQCGPCANGLPRMAETLRALADPATVRAGTVDEVRRLTALVYGRGSCHHPDGTSRFVLSSLTAFADEVEAHLNGRCLEDPR